MEQDSQPLFFDPDAQEADVFGGGASQEPPMSELLAARENSSARAWMPGPPESYWGAATISPLDTLDFDALRVYDDPRSRMHGVMGYVNGDRFIVSPFQVNHEVEPFTTIAIVDGDTRDPQHGEIVYQRMSTNPTRTPVVLIDAATLQVNATDNVYINGGVFVAVNLDRVYRDEHGTLIIAAMDIPEFRVYTDDNGHSQIAIEGATEFGLNMNHIVLNPSALADATPLEAYNDFHSEVIRRFEAIFGAGSFMQRLWNHITDNVLSINQQLTDHHQHLLSGINPANQPANIVDFMRNSARLSVDQLRHAYIDHILANRRDDEITADDRSDVEFIRNNFDALVNLVTDVNNLRNTLPATEVLHITAVANAQMYGVNFRERGPTSPELEAFETNAIRDIASRLRDVLPIDVWREAVRMFRYDDPITVIRNVIAQGGIALPGDLQDILDRAEARIGVLRNQIIRSGGRQLPGDAHARMANELADAEAANALLTRSLADERAAHARTRAEGTQQVTEGRVSIARLTQELAAMTARHEQLTREFQDSLKKAEEKGHKEGVEQERESAMRAIARLETEIAKLKGIMDDARGEEGGFSFIDEDEDDVAAVMRRVKKADGSRKTTKRGRE